MYDQLESGGAWRVFHQVLAGEPVFCQAKGEKLPFGLSMVLAGVVVYIVVALVHWSKRSSNPSYLATWDLVTPGREIDR